MTTDGAEGYPTREDRIVAEFGDGLDAEGIASRYGLTVAQVYAVVEHEVGASHPGPLSPPSWVPPSYVHQAPPNFATAHEYGFQSPPIFLDDDAIVAEYSEGHDVEWIARKHSINVERVYEVVQRIVQDNPQPPPGPTW